MALASTIEWTNSTWNPLTGCTKISAGCANCYAERMALRLKAMGNPSYRNGFTLTIHENALELPFKWKKPQNIFVNSMSDLFHKDVTDQYILRVFNVMNEASWHKYQVLTKRSERLLEMSQKLTWTSNIWMGVSVENRKQQIRIENLRRCGAVVKFLSLEPLLENIPELDLTAIDWVIVGGESGPKARPLDESWVVSIRNQCRVTNIPFFFKQWGGVNKKKAGRELEGKTWSEMPLTLTSALV